MPRVLKSDAEVALDDVTRLSARTIRMLEDLGRLMEDRALAERLLERAADRRTLLDDLGRAMRRGGGVPPADEDPERAHLQALWNKIKAALGSDETGVVRQALTEQDRELTAAIATALSHDHAPAITAALRALAAHVADDAMS